MATYVNDLRLKEIATGDESGTWGTSTNTNLELIGEALGYSTEGITTNADTHTTTVADGSTDPGRAMYIKYTGALDSDCTITIAPNTMSRVHFIENATTDSGSSGPYNIIISQGSGANVTIPNGFVKAVYLDGAGSGAAVTEAFDNLSVGANFRIGSGAAEDTSLVFDGNAQDFYIGLDDSADDLIIGLGSTVGTTPIISIDENKDVAIPDGGLTITTDDNTTQLTLTSTDADASPGPQLDMVRDSGSPADSDVLGRIRFRGDNDAGEVTTMVYLQTYLHDASDGTEDGGLDLFARQAGTLNRRITINTSGEICFNEDSADIDFRVESNGNANMLFVDGGNNHVNFGTATDHGGVVNIESTDNTSTLVLACTDADANVGPRLDLTRDSSSPAADDYLGAIRWVGEDDADNALSYAHMSTYIEDPTDGAEDGKFEIDTRIAGTMRSRLLIHSTQTVFNQEGQDVDFRVESDANAHAIFLEASSDKLGIGVSSPIARLSLPAQATGDSGIARIAIESAVDDNDFMVSQYEDSSGTYTLIGQNLGLNSTGNDTILDGGHRTAAIRLDARGSGSTQFLNGGTNASAETMRIDSSGQLLHGTTAVPTGVLLGRQLVSASATGAEIIAFRSDTSVAVDDISGAFLIGNSDTSGTEDHFVGMWARVTSANGSQELRFAGGRSGYEDNEPHMKIGSGGDVSLPSQVATGTLPQGKLEVVADASSNCINTQIATAGAYACFGASGPTTSGGNTYQFGRMINSSGSQAGTIVVNHSSVTYNTTSDYRLKENVTELTSATTRLKQLQPKRFNFIEVPDKTVDGFLAHEVSSVVPEAVTGEKDAVDADGNPDYQGIDQSKLVPLLVAAIQEQQTLIETLQTKVAALEEA